MYIRVVGCEGFVKYIINELDILFEVDENGRIWFVKLLNYNKVKFYIFNVKVVVGGGKCIVYVKVDFEILNMNKYVLRFEFEKYSCDIIENTRDFRINLLLRVLDDDLGDVGKVKNVVIVEFGLLFVFIVDDKGNV